MLTVLTSGKDTENLDYSYNADGNVNSTTASENSWVVSKEGKYPFTIYDPAVQLLSIYTRQIKAYDHTKTYKKIFMAILSVMAKTLETTQMSINK